MSKASHSLLSWYTGYFSQRLWKHKHQIIFVNYLIKEYNVDEFDPMIPMNVEKDQSFHRSIAWTMKMLQIETGFPQVVQKNAMRTQMF